MKKALLISGLVLHIFYYAIVVLSLGDYGYLGHGVGKAFRLWIVSCVLAVLVIVVYLADAVFCIIKNKSTFGIIKLSAFVIALPVFFAFGVSGVTLSAVIWQVFFGALFVLQCASLFVKCEDN